MIKIRYKKLVPRNGVLSVKILKIKMLSGKDMPNQYHAKGPACYLANLCREYGYPKKATIVTMPWILDLPQDFLSEGDIISEKDFQVWLHYLRACGSRLQDINRNIAQKRKAWNGTDEVTI